MVGITPNAEKFDEFVREHDHDLGKLYSAVVIYHGNQAAFDAVYPKLRQRDINLLIGFRQLFWNLQFDDYAKANVGHLITNMNTVQGARAAVEYLKEEFGAKINDPAYFDKLSEFVAREEEKWKSCFGELAPITRDDWEGGITSNQKVCNQIMEAAETNFMGSTGNVVRQQKNAGVNIYPELRQDDVNTLSALGEGLSKIEGDGYDVKFNLIGLIHHMRSLPGQIAALEMLIDRFPRIEDYLPYRETFNGDMKVRWIRAFGSLDVIAPHEYGGSLAAHVEPEFPAPPAPSDFS